MSTKQKKTLNQVIQDREQTTKDQG